MLPLIDEKSEVLITKVENFDFENAEAVPSTVVETLISNLKYYSGYGISANQLEGLENIRAFVFQSENDHDAMFNPEIIESSKKVQYGKEGCMNFPFLIHSVYRPQWVEVKYNDVDGQEHITKFSGFTSRILSQLIDLLNGVRFFDVVSRDEKSRGKHRRKINRRRALAAQKQISEMRNSLREAKAKEQFI